MKWAEVPAVRQTILFGILAYLLAFAGPFAGAQTSAGESVQPSVRLEHTTHPLAIPANAVGPVEGGQKLRRMVLVLAPPAGREAELNRLLAEQQNPSSPSFHHWLTAAEFGARFGAADSDVQKVRAWLEGAGFTVGRVAASKRWLEFSGTVEEVEAAFQTQMNYYQAGEITYMANTTDLSVPVEMAGIARGVVSLNNFGRTLPIHEAGGLAGTDTQGHKVKMTPNLTASGAININYVAPGDFAAIYNTKALLSSGIDGSGVSVAVLGQSQIELTDVREFRELFQLKANDPNILVSGPDPGVASQLDAEEALLDVEWAGAVAPGATIDLVIAGSTDATSGVDLAAAYAVDNAVAPILVYSYASCEQELGAAGNAFYNALWQQAAAEGITVLVAAGDNGAAGCDNPNAGMPAASGPAVNGVASTPYNVAVGGTEFMEGPSAATYWNGANTADYSAAVGYIPEAAWNESCDGGQAAGTPNCASGNTNFSLLASAGGASAINAKPSWQVGQGVPEDGARDVPDVAMAAGVAHDELVYCSGLEGTPCRIGEQQQLLNLSLAEGTSAATSAMAGILALVEQKNGAFQGQVNYVLYRLAQEHGNSCDSSAEMNPAAASSCVFYDVTAGNNSVPCAGGSPGCSSTQKGVNGILRGAVAGPGYDQVTGLGSVNAANLAAAWPTSNPAATPAISGSFSLSVSPNPIVFTAGGPGSGTVTITPSGGFSGTVVLACGTGGTSAPAGYNCNFGSGSVVVDGSAATTSINLAVATNVAAGVKTARAGGNGGALFGSGLAAALLLLGLFGMGASGERGGRNFFLAFGLVFWVLSSVSACGGGGGGGGLVSTTTTISSSNLHVGYGTPVTFTVTVTPVGSATPTGLVQLYDNGQALGSATRVTEGFASFLAASLPVGVHVITAQYLGDANTQGSTSAPITQLIAGTVTLQISGTSGGSTETANVNLTLI